MNKRKLEDFSVLAPPTPITLKKKQKNLLGYLKYRYIGHSQYRANNDDWFYVSNAELLNETGVGSKATLYLYLNQFITSGIIEKQTGDRHHSNMYRFTSEYKDPRFDYKPIENCTTRVSDIEADNEKTVPPMEIETVLPDLEQNCTTDKDKEKEKECTNNETDCSTVVQSGINNENGFDMEQNERLNSIKNSIERFIAAVPTLDDNQVSKYIGVYSTKLKEVCSQAEADSIISATVARIAKARTPKAETDGKITVIKPLDWMLKDLPAPTGNGLDIKTTVSMYCQLANQHLVDELKTEYAYKVPNHQGWYILDLFNNYSPVMVEQGVDTCIENAEEHIAYLWNRHCPKFNLDNLTAV